MDYETRYAIFIQMMGFLFGLQMVNAFVVLFVITTKGRKIIWELPKFEKEISFAPNKISTWLMRFFASVLVLIVILAIVFTAIFF